LPNDLQPLLRRQFLQLQYAGFRHQVDILINAIVASRTNRVEALVAAGDRARDEGTADRALELWRQALVIDPSVAGIAEPMRALTGHETVNRARGDELKAGGHEAMASAKYELAFQQFEKAVQTNPRDSEARALMQLAASRLEVQRELDRRLVSVQLLTNRGR